MSGSLTSVSVVSGVAVSSAGHYSWHSGMDTAGTHMFAAFAAKPAAPVNVKRSPQRLGEALR